MVMRQGRLLSLGSWLSQADPLLPFDTDLLNGSFQGCNGRSHSRCSLRHNEDLIVVAVSTSDVQN
jgi:hypothetical protein